MSCKNRATGCDCEDGTCPPKRTGGKKANECYCRKNFMECDPDLCKCFCQRNGKEIKRKGLKVEFCRNSECFYRCQPKLLLTKSLVCDELGIIAGVDINQGDYIGEYIGEIITEAENDTRNKVYGTAGMHYSFILNEDKNIDPVNHGNKLKFINHSYDLLANAGVTHVLVKGTFRILMSALESIKKGQEIFFDYGPTFNIEWKQQFNQFAQNFLTNFKAAKQTKNKKNFASNESHKTHNFNLMKIIAQKKNQVPRKISNPIIIEDGDQEQ